MPARSAILSSSKGGASTKGQTQIWLSGAALSAILLSVVGLLAIVCLNGMGFFWPSRLVQFSSSDGRTLLGELTDSDYSQDGRKRLQLKVGNRDLNGSDFIWIDEAVLSAQSYPPSAIVIERREWGKFFGFPVQLRLAGSQFDFPADPHSAEAAKFFERLSGEIHRTVSILADIRKIEREGLGILSQELEQLRLEQNRLNRSAAERPAAKTDPDSRIRLGEISRRIERLQNDYRQIESDLTVRKLGLNGSLALIDINGSAVELPLAAVVDFYPANQLSFPSRIGRYFSGVWRFISADPRESNTEGGVFPAIFGTVMMVVLMSIITTPLGVITALYLREYSRQGPFVSFVRICVANLAGVPSIVYGVFGLGFFVYFIGGNIDQSFFSESLPNPTFGTGGILWASLTLALLTLPTVIVTTEEGLAALPRHLREASLALGATKAETVIKVILPALSPSILTGVILATARAAGEVAPLMLTGVVKLAPELPIDAQWPFFHFDRKFMHLGFHIFDVGFQSPNVEAARPMVFATTVLLLLIVVLLNVTAVIVRAKLREKYSSSAI